MGDNPSKLSLHPMREMLLFKMPAEKGFAHQQRRLGKTLHIFKRINRSWHIHLMMLINNHLQAVYLLNSIKINKSSSNHLLQRTKMRNQLKKNQQIKHPLSKSHYLSILHRMKIQLSPKNCLKSLLDLLSITLSVLSEELVNHNLSSMKIRLQKLNNFQTQSKNRMKMNQTQMLSWLNLKLYPHQAEEETRVDVINSVKENETTYLLQIVSLISI